MNYFVEDINQYIKGDKAKVRTQQQWPNHTQRFFFLFLRIVFTLTNSVDHDEMPHYASFHRDIHYLLNYSFRGFRFTKGFSAK